MVSKETPKVDVKKALESGKQRYEATLTEKDAILYALSIGFSKDPMDKEQFKFTYENDSDFRTFPTNALTVCHRGPFSEGNFDVEGIAPFNPMMLLHGEEELTILKPLKHNNHYVINERLIDYQDKVKGALMWLQADIHDAATNEIVAVTVSNLYVRGAGGFGHKGTMKSKIPKKLPTREPDFVGEAQTAPGLAILYRLNGDKNPLHMDPEMAKMGGFD